DAAQVAGEHHRPLADAGPHDAGVVLLLECRLGVDEHAARVVAVDLEPEDLARVALGLVGGVGELHAAGLHAAAGEDLRLDDDGAADALGDLPRLALVLGEAVVGDGDAGPLDDLAGFVFEEPHEGGGAYRPPAVHQAGAIAVPPSGVSTASRCVPPPRHGGTTIVDPALSVGTTTCGRTPVEAGSAGRLGCSPASRTNAAAAAFAVPLSCVPLAAAPCGTSTVRIPLPRCRPSV